MSDISPEPLPEPVPEAVRPAAAPSAPASLEPQRSSMDLGLIASIVVVVAFTVVALCCIGSCLVIGFAFMQNPPW